jgi:predicted transcriptional regulator
MKFLSSADRALLISIKPRYSKRIFEGKKTIELRRTRPRINPGEIILIYESAPTMAIIGAAFTDKVIVDSPNSLWELAKKEGGISHTDYRSYFDGSTKAVGIVFKKPRRFAKPLPLNTLKLLWDNFHPPQTFRYLNKPQLFDLVTASTI